MIIDTLENAEKYFVNHPLFETAFHYIKSAQLLLAESGKVPVSDGLVAIYSDSPGKTQEEAVAKFECHNKNIDIQVCIRGNEKLGWKPRKDCVSPRGEYNTEKDVLFYDDAPDMFFGLNAGQFAIFYPEDVHAPMIGEGLIKKLVLKVKI